jgi:DNA-binding PadR family transcriptional regulator
MSLLTLLDERPMYGLELKSEFEAGTGGVWPLNVGQVYTTLGRLERDGLVVLAQESPEGQKIYEITPAGSATVAEWFRLPSAPTSEARDEMVLKLSLAATKAGLDVESVIQGERRGVLERLQEYTRLKKDPPSGNELSWMILLDSLIFQTEARARWLDSCEARIARFGSSRSDRRDSTSVESAIEPDEVRQ